MPNIAYQACIRYIFQAGSILRITIGKVFLRFLPFRDKQNCQTFCKQNV